MNSKKYSLKSEGNLDMFAVPSKLLGSCHFLDRNVIGIKILSSSPAEFLHFVLDPSMPPG